MRTRTRIVGVARLGAVLVLAAGVWVVGQASAGAADQVTPAPLATVGDTAASLLPPLPTDPPPLSSVVGTAKGALGAAGPGAGSVAPSGSQPGSPPAQSGSGAAAGPSASTPANSAARVSVQPAQDDDTVAGADVTVRGLLGACVRLTSSGVPARATVVVLDQNLLDQLKAVGLPVERLVVPCPAGAAVGAWGANGANGGANAGTTSAAATGDPELAGNDGLLAFTGADLAPTLLLAGGLIALGIAFLRKARVLVDDRVPVTRTARRRTARHA